MRYNAGQQQGGRWDEKLYPGVDVRSIPVETRGLLAQTVGVLGVEAEYFLALVRPVALGGPNTPATRQDGERFLWQLDAFARRLISAADGVELATQAYLAQMENHHPDLSVAGDLDASAPWWPETGRDPFAGGSLELGLRRRGYAYRHVAAAHLADHVQAIGEQLALVLHALATLPPAGVLPLASLHTGLYELSEAMQGDVVMRHLRDVSAEHPGLLTGIARLRQLDASEDTSIEADIAWARGQLDALDALSAIHPALTATAPQARRGLASLFRRAPAVRSKALDASGAAAIFAQARRDWAETIAALESLRQPALARQPSGRR